MRIKIILTIGIIVSLLLSGCADKTDKNNSEVKIGYFPNITHAQALVMKQQKTLEKSLGDIPVKWICFNAGPAEIEALYAGEVDIGYIGPVPALNGYVKSCGDLKIIAGASNGGSVLMTSSNADINSVNDLSGKTIAVPQIGNTQHLELLSVLSDNNLKTKSEGGNVTIAASSNADVENLMNQKNIDAAFVPEPWGSILEMNGSANVLLDYNQIDKDIIPSTAVVIVSKDFLADHGDIVKTFMNAHKEATMFINDNKSQAEKIINDQIYDITEKKIEDKIIDNAFERLEVSYEIPKDSIMKFADLCIKEKLISKMPDDNIFDDTYIK